MTKITSNHVQALRAWSVVGNWNHLRPDERQCLEELEIVPPPTSDKRANHLANLLDPIIKDRDIAERRVTELEAVVPVTISQREEKRTVGHVSEITSLHIRAIQHLLSPREGRLTSEDHLHLTALGITRGETQEDIADVLFSLVIRLQGERDHHQSMQRKCAGDNTALSRLRDRAENRTRTLAGVMSMLQDWFRSIRGRTDLSIGSLMERVDHAQSIVKAAIASHDAQVESDSGVHPTIDIIGHLEPRNVTTTMFVVDSTIFTGDRAAACAAAAELARRHPGRRTLLLTVAGSVTAAVPEPAPEPAITWS